MRSDEFIEQVRTMADDPRCTKKMCQGHLRIGWETLCSILDQNDILWTNDKGVSYPIRQNKGLAAYYASKRDLITRLADDPEVTMRQAELLTGIHYHALRRQILSWGLEWKNGTGTRSRNWPIKYEYDNELQRQRGQKGVKERKKAERHQQIVTWLVDALFKYTSK